MYVYFSKELSILVDQVEVNKLYQVFMELSNNGKEPLNKEAFTKGLAMLSKCGLKNLETPFVERLFTLLDIDGNGTIDLQEFVTGLSMLCKGSMEEKLSCNNLFFVFLNSM